MMLLASPRPVIVPAESAYNQSGQHQADGQHNPRVNIWNVDFFHGIKLTVDGVRLARKK
jgi:hypothetical protein